MLLHFSMAQSTPVMTLMLSGAMAALALFLCWLSFASPLASAVQNWKGIVPPFVGVPAVLFAQLSVLNGKQWRQVRNRQKPRRRSIA